ncbi:MAG: TonB-dependent receptor [Opitutaceae bacterium]|nr:TonB-dependent receptor [Opitutaceae bacterium]
MQTRSAFLAVSLGALTLFESAAVALAQTAADSQDADPEVLSLEAFKITAATRTEKVASALPVSTTVVGVTSLDRQFAISSDVGTALAQFIPGYAPSRQKLSSAGESFRGRDPLYLVDGIPQSNPLRAGKRESITVDPFFLERIEAVHGSSATQGMGATGGLINFVTRVAPAADGFTSSFETSGVTSTRFKSGGYGGKVAALTAARAGAASVVAGATWEHKPFGFDGEGRPLGVDNVQGETLDSDTWSLFVKAGYDFNPRHRVELMVNRFSLAQNLNWTAVNGNRLTGLPTTSVRGSTPGLPAENDVTSAALTFTDRELFDGELTVNVFSQDFTATYGATTSANGTFRLNGVPTLDQSRIVAEKHGLRTTWARTFPSAGDLGVVTGFDYLADETAQVLVLTGRTWVPYTTFFGWSPYLQLEKPLGNLTLSGGLRYELAELEVDDFTTLESAGSTFVRGGNPSFEEPLVNVGANWRVSRRVTLFGGFAQGYGMADIGRILRAVNTPGLDVDTFINLNPVVTDNWETGIRLHGNGWKFGWSAFLSTAELGARLVANASGIYDVVREKSETYGTEITGDVRLPGRLGTVGGYLALLEGKSDRDGDGTVDRRLPGANISAPKLSLFWDKSWSPHFSTRLQSMTLLRRSDPDGIAAGDFDGYTLVDALANWRVRDNQTVSVGVENLLDHDYISYYSQTLTGSTATAANLYAGRGRTLSVRYRFGF